MAKKSLGVFLGNYLVSLDPRGRCRMPAAWRPLLLPARSSGIMLLPSEEMCILIMSVRAFRVECTTVRRQEKRGSPGKSSTGEDLLAARRMIDAAVHVGLDARGRFKIPEDLRRLAELDQQAHLIGAFDCAEIWSPSRYTAMKAEAVDIPEGMSKYIGM